MLLSGWTSPAVIFEQIMVDPRVQRPESIRFTDSRAGGSISLLHVSEVDDMTWSGKMYQNIAAFCLVGLLSGSELDLKMILDGATQRGSVLEETNVEEIDTVAYPF